VQRTHYILSLGPEQLPDPWTTTRHVYAVGARIGEVPFVEVRSKLMELGAVKSVSGRRRSRRRMFRRLTWGAVRGYAPICYDSYDNPTVLEAFKGRLLRDLPSVNARKIKLFAKFVQNWLDSHLSELRKVQLMSFEEWLDSENYPEWRKQQLRQSYLELRGGLPSRKRSSHIDAFVKGESYSKYKRPRMINSRVDDFKVIAGRYFKSIERVLYDMVMPVSFIKHVPVPQRPALVKRMSEFVGMRCRATDYTAFESSISSEIMVVCECALYHACFPDDPIMDFICDTIKGENVMRTRTGVKVCCTGRRMSGDMCTSLGNGFTNLMVSTFIAGEGHIFGYVEGDDGLFMVDHEIDPQDYADLGFAIKIEKFDSPCHASFCGLVFSESSEIIRDPFRFMQNFGWTMSCINAGPRVLDELLRAKALSVCYETPQCPIVGAFARRALERTMGSNPRWVNDGYHVPPDAVDIPKFEPKADTRALFALRYGVSVPQQLEVEKCIMHDDLDQVSVLCPAGLEYDTLPGQRSGSSPDVAHYAQHFLEIT